MYLFTDPTEHIDTIMRVTPYTAAGYGLALLVLATVAFIFYKRWVNADEYIRELLKLHNEAEKKKLEAYISNQFEVKTNQQAIKEQLKQIFSKL